MILLRCPWQLAISPSQQVKGGIHQGEHWQSLTPIPWQLQSFRTSDISHVAISISWQSQPVKHEYPSQRRHTSEEALPGDTSVPWQSKSFGIQEAINIRGTYTWGSVASPTTRHQYHTLRVLKPVLLKKPVPHHVLKPVLLLETSEGVRKNNGGFTNTRTHSAAAFVAFIVGLNV